MDYSNNNNNNLEYIITEVDSGASWEIHAVPKDNPDGGWVVTTCNRYNNAELIRDILEYDANEERYICPPNLHDDPEFDGQAELLDYIAVVFRANKLIIDLDGLPDELNVTVRGFGKLFKHLGFGDRYNICQMKGDKISKIIITRKIGPITLWSDSI